MKILVLGASGMIGSTVYRVLSQTADWEVVGTVRDDNQRKYFTKELGDKLVSGIDASNSESLESIFGNHHPDVAINCIGLTKHIPDSDDPLLAIPLNALLPHKLSDLCKRSNTRFIHISTDCIFSGKRGNYTEEDPSDAADIYGKSKYLGEINSSNAITLRTSTIGHELNSAHGLLEWFLEQEKSCKGYVRAIFSGLPTVVLGEIIRDIVISRPELSGVYHVGGKKITKFDLLNLIAEIYKKSINIVPDNELVVDRSLVSDRFEKATGFVAPFWPELIRKMHSFR